MAQRTAKKASSKTAAAPKTRAAKPAPQAAKEPLLFALDIGTRSVVGIVGYQEEERFHIVDFEQMEHPGRAMIDGQVEDIHQVAQLIGTVKQRLQDRVKQPLTQVAVAAAGRALRTVQVRIERRLEPGSTVDRAMVMGMEGEAIEKAQQQMEAEMAEQGNHTAFYCVGYNITQYWMDGEPIQNMIGHSCITAALELIAAFLPRTVVEGLYASVDKNNLEVTSLTLEPIAAINVLFPRELWLLNLALVDIGAGTSDIAVCRDGRVTAFDMATIAGDEVTEAIIRKYLVSFEMAERMKRTLSADTESIVYTNIVGGEETVSREDLLQTVQPVTELLAKTISERLLAVNHGKPDALFLIGGGSLIPGLSASVSKYLGLDENKIAVGAKAALKNVMNMPKELLGPEFITPIGIAISAIIQDSFYFFGVTINGRRVKLLNARTMRLMDILLMAGYKTSQVIGRSGRSLIFTVNGGKQMIPGVHAEPAKLTVDGAEASVETVVQPGQTITFVPAENGQDATAVLTDVIPMLSDAFVTVAGVRYPVGLYVTKDGKPLSVNYAIRPYDQLVLRRVGTLGDLIKTEGLDTNASYSCIGMPLTPESELIDAMDILAEKRA